MRYISVSRRDRKQFKKKSDITIAVTNCKYNKYKNRMVDR